MEIFLYVFVSDLFSITLSAFIGVIEQCKRCVSSLVEWEVEDVEVNDRYPRQTLLRLRLVEL